MNDECVDRIEAGIDPRRVHLDGVWRLGGLGAVLCSALLSSCAATGRDVTPQAVGGVGNAQSRIKATGESKVVSNQGGMQTRTQAGHGSNVLNISGGTAVALFVVFVTSYPAMRQVRKRMWPKSKQ